MKENKLADLSMDFSVQIINLVKDLKARHESVISNQIGRTRKKHLQMHRTLKDNDSRVRALRRARELREVSASLFFLPFFLFISVHSTIKPTLSTIMVENQRR